MREWRMVELRPGVFSVETRTKILWWWGHWRPYEESLIPSIPEYSPTRVREFSEEGAVVQIRLDRAAYEEQRLRDNPPPGYPRVVETKEN